MLGVVDGVTLFDVCSSFRTLTRTAARLSLEAAICTRRTKYTSWLSSDVRIGV